MRFIHLFATNRFTPLYHKLVSDHLPLLYI